MRETPGAGQDEITKKQYGLIHPYLPIQRGNVRISNLSVINAILFVAENGCKWHRVYIRMRRWVDAGVLDRLFDALQKHHMIRISVDCLGLDSTSIKVHPDGTGAPKKTGRNRLGNHAVVGTPKSN